MDLPYTTVTPMGFLDKLKPNPRWKHADPAVRLEAVRELEDPAELAILAETDPDTRVRRAAIPRTVDTAVLGRVADSDADLETRDRAADWLVAMATSGADDETAVAAVATLTDSRRLSAIARSTAPEAVRAEALKRTTDPRGLGGVARHAKHEATAIAAVAQLDDRDELIEVAQNAEHKDVALAAFEKLLTPAPDLALLRTIETRTSQKAVAKRARGIIADAEAAEAARLAAIEERRRRQSALCDSVERLATLSDAAAIRAELARLSEAWTTEDVTDEPARERFAAARTQAEAAIDAREREAAEAAERARQRAEAIATREALCVRVETLDGDDVLAQLVPIEEEWRSLTPRGGDGPEAATLAERFARAVAACRKRHELGALLADTRAAYETLVSEAEGLLSSAVSGDAGAALARWPSLSREARSHAQTLSAASRPATDLDARLTAVGEALTAREAAREQERRDALAHATQNALAQLQRLSDRARRASEADTITLKEGDRLMKDIGAGLDLAGRLDKVKEVQDAMAALRTLQEQVAPRVRELREMDDWRRFANAQRQEQLIAMAEAIVVSLKAEAEQQKESDLAATSRALKELHANWSEVAEAPRNVAQRLWDRFRAATDFIRARCEPYFQKMREERTSNLSAKQALVTEAESLASSTDWAKTTVRFQELQKAWQASGPVPRDAGRDLAQRFRVASGAFFTRRREDLAARKQVWSENLAKKEALCARAEVLAESTDWDATSSEMKRLQHEWKTVGPIRRNKSDEMWNRFRAAGDKFFERYHNRHQIALASKLAEREAMVVALETMAAGDSTDDLSQRVQQLRTTWNRAVPIPSSEAKVLADRWQVALTNMVQRHAAAFTGTDLDPAVARQRMEKLVAKVEAFLTDVRDATDGLSPTEALAAKRRSALASNAMGGRATDEGKWRGALEAVKEAQASWDRLSPIAGPEARSLEHRFRDACRKVSDYARRHSGHPPSSGPRRDRPRDMVTA